MAKQEILQETGTNEFEMREFDIDDINTGSYFIQLLDLEHIVSDFDPKSAEETWSSDG